MEYPYTKHCPQCFVWWEGWWVQWWTGIQSVSETFATFSNCTYCGGTQRFREAIAKASGPTTHRSNIGWKHISPAAEQWLKQQRWEHGIIQ